MQTLTTSALRELIEGRKPVVINVLPQEHYDRAHVPGSINIPVGDKNFIERVKEAVADPSDPVVVYCANTECDASPKAAKMLEQAGFTDVYDYEAGTEGWKEAGFDLAGTESVSG